VSAKATGSYHDVVVLGVLVAVLGYLLGTVPTALLVGRRIGRNPTLAGSGNPGASNVYRTAGAKAGAAVFAGDLLKGAVATGIGLAAGDRTLALVGGVAAVLGHVAPATRRFRGGKGVATACGLIVVLFPVLALVLAVVWAVIAKVTGKASLASIVLAVLIPIAVAAMARPAVEVVGIVVVAALVVVRHAGNIGRLVRGEERSLR
jgi:glycerol-3-phosphate acyltransferase PlsY